MRATRHDGSFEDRLLRCVRRAKAVSMLRQSIQSSFDVAPIDTEQFRCCANRHKPVSVLRQSIQSSFDTKIFGAATFRCKAIRFYAILLCLESGIDKKKIDVEPIDAKQFRSKAVSTQRKST